MTKTNLAEWARAITVVFGILAIAFLALPLVAVYVFLPLAQAWGSYLHWVAS